MTASCTLDELHAAYVAGKLDRRPYFEAVAEIHAAMSAAVPAGPCVCLACRTTRAEQAGR